MHIVKHALAGAVCAASAVVAGSITWTLTQAYMDRKHMRDHWAERRLEAARASHPQLPSSPYIPKTLHWDIDAKRPAPTVTFAYPPPFPRLPAPRVSVEQAAELDPT